MRAEATVPMGHKAGGGGVEEVGGGGAQVGGVDDVGQLQALDMEAELAGDDAG